MDYRQFRFEAVVDFIEIEFQIEHSRKGHTIKKYTGLSYVEPIHRGAGGAATIFRTRLHDPVNWRDVERRIAAIADKYPFARPATISGVELALDAYHREGTGYQASPEAFAALIQHIYKFMSRPVSRNHRIYRDFKGSGRAIPKISDSLSRHLQDGWNIGIGNRKDPQYQHLYFKTTDRDQVLPSHQHRARYEIRLQEASVPCSTQAGWQAFRFESLAKFFQFRIPKPDLAPILEIAIDAQAQYGKRKVQNRKEGGTRLYPKGSQADRELNDVARAALRGLSLRWKSSTPVP